MATFVYVVARDFGFAPNPFHGYCTLATCKPVIRRVAKIDDWVVGVGGKDLNATGRLIFAMQVTEAMSFNDYWSSPEHQDKRPVRNGSRKMMVGDNIYHRTEDEAWEQLDSHHSRPDGSPDASNIKNDTQTDRMLLSRHFVYFGANAPEIPPPVLQELGYSNRRHHRTFKDDEAAPLISWIRQTYGKHMNLVMGDPFQFKASGARYSASDDKIKY